MRREYVEGHASLCGGGATKGLRARLVALEEGLEFDDVVRYRKLGRALHTHNTGGGGGSSGAERNQGKEDTGFFGWFQKKQQPPAAAAEPQGLEVATAAAAAAAAASSDSGVIDEQALQRLGEMLEVSDAKAGLRAGFGVEELLPLSPPLADFLATATASYLDPYIDGAERSAPPAQPTLFTDRLQARVVMSEDCARRKQAPSRPPRC